MARGHRRLTATFGWVGSRFQGGGLIPEDAVGIERGEVTVDDGSTRPMTIRVTHADRRLDGIWRLVHRQCASPPTDRPQEAR